MRLKMIIFALAVAVSVSAFCFASCAEEVAVLGATRDYEENVSGDDGESDEENSATSESATDEGDDSDGSSEDDEQEADGRGQAVCAHVIEHVEYVAATCLTDGNVEYWYCTECGGYYLDEDASEAVDEEDIVIAAENAEHVGEWEVSKSPSCVGKGERVLECTVCKTIIREDIAATGEHEYGEWGIVTEASCESEGEKARACIYCGDVQTEEVEQSGHEYVLTNGQKPTCTEAGYNYYKCSNCNEEYTEEFTALGHDYVNHEAQAATCTEAGWEKYRTCSRCDYTTYTEIPATGHSYTSATADNGIKYTCNNCGDTYTEQKSEYTLTYEPTSDGEGYIVTGIEDVSECIELIIPDTYNGMPVTGIAENAFYGNNYITSVTIGENVTTIGASAFYGCASIQALYIPESLQTFGANCFYGCTYITVIYYNAVSAVIESNALDTFCKAGRDTDGITLYVGSSVVSFPINLFTGTDCANLDTSAYITEIVFAENSSLETIGARAFAGCNGLQIVYIPSSCTKISSEAFACCTSLVYAEVPKTAEVNANAFYNVASGFVLETYEI